MEISRLGHCSGTLPALGGNRHGECQRHPECPGTRFGGESPGLWKMYSVGEHTIYIYVYIIIYIQIMGI